MKRVFVHLALGMAALYLALVVGVAGCLLMQPGPSAGHHHQKSHVAHSAFCAWACQANPTVGALVEAPIAVLFELVALLILVRTSMAMRLPAHRAHSRAPPSSLLLN